LLLRTEVLIRHRLVMGLDLRLVGFILLRKLKAFLGELRFRFHFDLVEGLLIREHGALEG